MHFFFTPLLLYSFTPLLLYSFTPLLLHSSTPKKEKNMDVAVIKYNAGNVYSVINALRRLGVEPVYTDDTGTIMSADKVVFPGQGEAAGTMDYLRRKGLDTVIKRLTQPVLGICIGQQLLCRHSEEGDTDCLGVFDADVLRFRPSRHEDKVPAMGWNALYGMKSALFDGLADDESFVYFVHSYYVPLSPFTAAAADYILPYSAAMHKDNFYATQFHPEKSGKVGETILRNFLEI